MGRSLCIAGCTTEGLPLIARLGPNNNHHNHHDHGMSPVVLTSPHAHCTRAHTMRSGMGMARRTNWSVHAVMGLLMYFVVAGRHHSSDSVWPRGCGMCVCVVPCARGVLSAMASTDAPPGREVGPCRVSVSASRLHTRATPPSA